MSLDSIKKYGKIHMIGIGGVSMSGLAELLTDYNILVTGSDAKESENTTHLKKIGLNICIGSNKEMVKNADLIV